MRTTFRNHTDKEVVYPVKLPLSSIYTVWISISLILIISLTSIAGWIFGNEWFTGFSPYWESMKVITAVCFILTSIALAFILVKGSVAFNSAIPHLLSLVLIVIGLLTIYCWLYMKATGEEVSIADMPVLRLFLSPMERMALVSAIIFLFTGMVLILLTFDNKISSNIAHALFFPAAVTSYLIPLNYLLSLFSAHQFLPKIIALNSGISFCAVCVAIYMIRPDTWFMKVFTSRESGGIMTRRLFPWILAFPVVIGWLRIYGEEKGFFISEVGVLLVAITYTFCFIFLVWLAARSVNLIDAKRRKTDEALKRSYDELENRVNERTSELLALNKVLDLEITERKKAETKLVILNSELEKRVTERTAEIVTANIELKNSQKMAHLGNWELNLLTDFLQWSDEVYRIFGVGREDFNSNYKSFLDCIHPEDIELVNKAYQDSLDSGKDEYEVCHRIIRKNSGEVRYVFERCRHIRNSDGTIIKSVGMAHDITESKKMELTLQRNNERLDILSQTSSQLLSSENPQELINALCFRVMRFMDCQVFFNFLVDEDIDKLSLNAYYGIPESTAREIDCIDFGNAVCGCAARDKARIVAENISASQDPRTTLVKALGIQAYACHPLVANDKVLGTLSFGTNSRSCFNEDDLSLMKTISDLVAVALARIKYEDSLRKSEERYRSLMELSPGASFVNKNGMIVMLNSAARRLLGINSAEEIIGKSALEIFHPHCHPLIRERIEKLMNGENVPMALEKIVRADGAIRDVEVVAARIIDSGGPAIQVIMSDITDRKLAEKELFDTKNYLENLINNANAPIIVWDKFKIIRLFNHAFENLTGYDSSEVEGRRVELLFPEDSLTESLIKIRDAQTHDLKTIEIPILTKKREIRIVLWNSAKIYNKSNKSYSTIAQGNDITERINAEQAFKKSREKLEIALENGKIGIWEWDLVSDVFNCDERMDQMFGWRQGSFENTYGSFEKSIHEEDLPHVRNAILRTINDKIPLDTVFRVRHENEDINYISTKAVVEADAGENPVKLSGVCFDITEMKKGAERTLFLLNEDLLRSNKDLEQFAYVASHDLQEPLRMVSSFTQLLSQKYKDKLDQEAQEFIRFAVDGASRMQVLINDLLEYSRIERRGKKFAPVDLHSILGQAIKNLRFSIHEHQAIVTNDELPTVLADEGQMVQLFQNLIGNALKFSVNPPRIHISVKEKNDQFLFSVKDNGIGIESHYYNRIFQIFQRLHAKDEYGGTGIGLAICKRIVNRHGGKIWVESEPDKGSVFYFTLINKLTYM